MSTKLYDLIQTHPETFALLCQRHGVNRMYGFGSSITDHFDEMTSDIDLLVEMKIENPMERGESLLSLWDQLEAFFGRKVDLLTEESIRNPVLKATIAKTKKLIYDGSGKKSTIIAYTADGRALNRAAYKADIDRAIEWGAQLDRGNGRRTYNW